MKGKGEGEGETREGREGEDGESNGRGGGVCWGMWLTLLCFWEEQRK